MERKKKGRRIVMSIVSLEVNHGSKLKFPICASLAPLTKKKNVSFAPN